MATESEAVTPVATPTAALLPAVERIELSPVAATVSLNPFDSHGNPRDVPGSVRLLATVVYSDGVHNDLVTWRSLDPALVQVSDQGEVRPCIPTGLPATGSTRVIATAQLDPAVTATCDVTVVP